MPTPQNPNEPDDHAIDNRKAQIRLLHDAAMRGDPISGAYFELESFVCKYPGGRFITDTGWMFRDVDEDDDIRPF